MGTSDRTSGPNQRNPLVPGWIDPDGTTEDTPAPTPSGAPPSKQPTPNRFQAPRSLLTRYAKSDGSDTKSLKSGLRSYTRSGVGGSKIATQRMGAARGAGARLVGILADIQTAGLDSALESRGLRELSGRPIEEVIDGIIDFLGPIGGTDDEAIARDGICEALVTIEGLSDHDLESLDQELIDEVVVNYISRTIMHRVAIDVGLTLVDKPSGTHAISASQKGIMQFIRDLIRDELELGSLSQYSGSPNKLLAFTDSLYEAAFELLQEA